MKATFYLLAWLHWAGQDWQPEVQTQTFDCNILKWLFGQIRLDLLPYEILHNTDWILSSELVTKTIRPSENTFYNLISFFLSTLKMSEL